MRSSHANPRDIPEAQLEALHALGKARNQTPAEFIAEAVSSALAQGPHGSAEPLSWKDMDGDEYQQKIRAEWDRAWDR